MLEPHLVLILYLRLRLSLMSNGPHFEFTCLYHPVYNLNTYRVPTSSAGQDCTVLTDGLFDLNYSPSGIIEIHIVPYLIKA